MRRPIAVARAAVAIAASLLAISSAFRSPALASALAPAFRLRHPAAAASLRHLSPASTRRFSTRSTAKDAAEDAEQALGVREVMTILERAYPNDGGDDGAQWAKTRRYLYQYCASTSSRASESGADSDDRGDAAGGEKEVAKQGRTRKRRSARAPLTPSDVDNLLSFLRNALPEHPELQARVLQRTPRILGRCRSIETRLVPTVELLRGLYGGIGVGGDMFAEAVARNTDLLLVRGVGYAGERGEASDGGPSGGSAGGVGEVSAVEEYLRRELGASSASIKKLKESHPTLFQLSLSGNVLPAVCFLHSVLGHGDISETPPNLKQKRQVARIIARHPTLLQLDAGTNLRPTADFLRDACDLTEKEMAAVAAASPGVLALSARGNLRSTLDFLGVVLASGEKKGEGDPGKGGGVVDVEDGDEAFQATLRGCILRHPPVLALSLENLRAKRNFFDSMDDANGNDGRGEGNTRNKSSLAARVLAGAPSAYSLSLNGNLRPKVERLQNLWSVPPVDGNGNCSDGSRSSLSYNLREYPQVLTLSLEGNVIPTLSFYNATGYVDLDHDGVPRKPPRQALRSRYVASSLYGRLLPRWHFLREERERKRQLKELEELVTSDGASKKESPNDEDLPPLHLLASASDDTFCKKMELSLNEYLAFREEAGPRLKFGEQFDRWLKTGRPIDVASG